MKYGIGYVCLIRLTLVIKVGTEAQYTNPQLCCQQEFCGPSVEILIEKRADESA